ncbi:MAG: hypothetical protein ACI4PE_03345 [Bacilli bacterium]
MNLIKKFYVKQFVHSIDKNIKVKFGKNLQCDIENQTIYVTNKTDKIDIQTFKEYVRELNSKCFFNTFILGILHEIGHIYTYDERDEEEYFRDNELLTLLFQEKKIDAVDFNKFYLRLEMEKKATQWAIDFSMLNKDFCKKYQKKLGKEIYK